MSRRAFLASAETGMPLWQDHLFIALARSASDASRDFCIPVDPDRAGAIPGHAGMTS